MQFTKQEAMKLFGQTVEITRTIYSEFDLEQKYPKIEKGTQAEVYLIENNPEGIIVNLLVDEDYEPFNKVRFESFCRVCSL